MGRCTGYMRLELALSLLLASLMGACADGVPLDELFPSDAGRSTREPPQGTAGGSSETGQAQGSAGSGDSLGIGSSGGSGSTDNGSAGASSAGGSNGSSGAGGQGSGGGAGSSAAGGGGLANHAGSTGAGGSTATCSAPAWDSMTVYCAQGVVGTEVSLNGKKYKCHYWTQAQNPADHNSADNSEPWSVPSDCP